MRLLAKTIHPNIKTLEGKTILKRIAARAIVLRGREILLLYTQRYDDFSLPGGGVDAREDIETGLVRELSEETGAKNISNIKEFGIYEEVRPWYRPDHDLVHMISHCFTCTIAPTLGQTRYESYEKNNGMDPRWVDIDFAIEHNKKIIAESEKKGLSIERETFLFKLIAKELC
ncbi:MAG: NUDIX domain-containing protein [Pseudomonadota bacterium]